MAWAAFTRHVTGAMELTITAHEANTLAAGIGQRELALMGLGTPFDARKPHHVQALRRYAASTQDVRTSVRVDL